MKKRDKLPKLTLHRETLQKLDEREIGKAYGAFPTSFGYCLPVYATQCNC